MKQAKFYVASVFWYENPWLTGCQELLLNIVRVTSLELLYRHGHEICTEDPSSFKLLTRMNTQPCFYFSTFFSRTVQLKCQS